MASTNLRQLRLRTLLVIGLVMMGYEHAVSMGVLGHPYIGEEKCGGTLTGTGGVLKSPGYPKDYQPNEDCKWIIEVEAGHVVELVFDDFYLEYWESCHYDAVIIRDGSRTSDDMLDRICSYKDSYSIQSTGPAMSIRFISDESEEYRGFSGRWMAKPDTTPKPVTTTTTATTTTSTTTTTTPEPTPTMPSTTSPPPTTTTTTTPEATTTTAAKTTKTTTLPPTTTEETSNKCGSRPYYDKDLFAGRRRRSMSYVHPSWNNSGPIVRAKPNISKVVGGSTATYGQYPWQVRIERQRGIRWDGSVEWEHHCGAVIIREYWLLSAAHCFVSCGRPRPKSSLRMIVGDHRKRVKDIDEEVFEVEDLTIHNNYSTYFKGNDIALIKIKPINGRGIVFSDFVQPACLPTGATPHADGTKCLISGWGVHYYYSACNRSSPHTLQGAEIPLISHRNCQSIYGQRFNDGMLCAGYMEGGVDTCQGDSGGPFVCEIEGAYTLLGLTSFGFGCGEPDFPGIYTRVAHFIPWIEEEMKTSGDARLPRS